MYKLVFFDTETTGNTEKDSIVQLAYKTDDEEFNALYNPGIKIPPEASAVHHITNKMVADKKSFEDSGDLPKVKKLFEDRNTVVVAHNAPFDLMMIKNLRIEPKNFICTLRVARDLDKDGKIERYNLQYLRYYLELEVDGHAHDALGDVLVCMELFNRLKKKIIESEGLDEQDAIEKMIEISSHPSLLRTFGFGKYIGQKIEDVAKNDPGYLDWLLKEKLKSDQIDEDWIYTLKHHLGK